VSTIERMARVRMDPKRLAALVTGGGAGLGEAVARDIDGFACAFCADHAPSITIVGDEIRECSADIDGAKRVCLPPSPALSASTVGKAPRSSEPCRYL
jgi:hypothetical protein